MPTIIDWPTSAAFRPATLRLGLDVSEAGAVGFYTGTITRRSSLADRMVVTLTLPPCLAAQASEREAFLLALKSNGYWVRMGMPHKRAPAGTARGAITVNASQAAGARTLSIGGATSSPNLLTSSGFEIDSNADGLADEWSAYFGNGSSTGRVWTVEPGAVAGGGSKVQRVTCAALNGDDLGVTKNVLGIQPSTWYTLSVWSYCSVPAQITLYIGWYGASANFISDSSQTSSVSTAAQRFALSAQSPATAARASIYFWMNSTSTPNPSLYLDAAQFELGTVATPYSGLPTLAAGDMLQIGSNLVQVAYPGAVANDLGVATVPLVSPLPVALGNGAGVTWSSPQGLWQLDDDGIELDYSAPVLQGGVALRLRQVVQ